MIKGRNLFCEKVSPLKPLFQKFGGIEYDYNIQKKYKRKTFC